MKGEKIIVPIEFECLKDETGGIMHVHISDCYGDVNVDGKLLGRVGASVGASIDVEIKKELWSAKPLALWQAVNAALKNKEGLTEQHTTGTLQNGNTTS